MKPQTLDADTKQQQPKKETQDILEESINRFDNSGNGANKKRPNKKRRKPKPKTTNEKGNNERGGNEKGNYEKPQKKV